MLVEELIVSAAVAGALAARISLAASTGATGASTIAGGGTSRAGAGALAAPLLANDEDKGALAAGMEAAGVMDAAGLDAGLAAGIAGVCTAAAGIGSLAVEGAALGTGLEVIAGFCPKFAGLAVGAALGFAAACGCGGTAAGLGARGREAETLGGATTDGAVPNGDAGRWVGGVGVVAAGTTGFPVSPFLSSPRATRSVPFACSTLMGLVRTRLAPMRKAFATPA